MNSGEVEQVLDQDGHLNTGEVSFQKGVYMWDSMEGGHHNICKSIGCHWILLCNYNAEWGRRMIAPVGECQGCPYIPKTQTK